MTETTEARRALVERLEDLARRRPRAYRLRVTALALFGLGYRAFVGLAMVAVPAAITFTMYPADWVLVIAIVLLILFGLFWFDRMDIRGQRLAPSDAPALFDALDTLRRKLRAPRVHEVVLDGQFNASAATQPRLGIFGWHKQTLVLGVPLLAALDREQLLAVVGHELGHFSKAHGRLGHWVYRIRESWEKLHTSMGDEDSGIGAAVNQFYRWFVPYFGAYSFALARLNEYEADGDAALASGPEKAASALAAVHVYGSYLAQEFWPRLWRRALDTPSLPDNPYRLLVEDLRVLPAEQLRELQREELRRSSDLADTHPSLAERLAALRASEVRLAAPALNAGEALLGERWPAVLEEAGRVWRAENEQAWRDHYERLSARARRLAALRAIRENGRTLSERIEIAALTAQVDGPLAAIALWRPLLAEAPDDPRIPYHLGRSLVVQRDAEAFAHLEALALRFPGYAPHALALMERLAIDLGDKTLADRCATRQRAALKPLNDASEKLAAAVETAALAAHGLPAQVVDTLSRQLAAHRAIAGAHLARISAPTDGHFQGYLLVIRIDPPEMDKLGVNFVNICDHARGLLDSLLEPCDLVWVLNFYTTEEVNEKIARALAALGEAARLSPDV